MMEKQIVIYEPDGKTRLEVKTDGETVWLTQEQMSQLFGRDRSVITKHIRNIFKEGESEEKVVCANFAYTVESDIKQIKSGMNYFVEQLSAPPEQPKRRQIEFIRYDVDGNPVNSTRRSRK